MAGQPDIDIRPVEDFAAVAPLWLDLERRAGGSFFQSWAWTGCLAAERFPDPWLLTARRGGTVVGLGLFNRGQSGRLGLSRPLLLGETGRAEVDTIFIEHNGLLLDRDEGEELARICWAALNRSGIGAAKWILSGVSPALRATLPDDRHTRIVAHRPAPYFDLAGSDMPVIDRLSANSRQQLRRSLRGWERIGPLKLDIAEDGDRAEMFLDELAVFHQRYWNGRGKPGAFAAPFFRQFHRALLERPAAGQSVDLIRVAAADRIIGYLHNFVHDGWVAAYQSGFDFGPDADALRPGLICHLLAMEHYRRAGMRLYDFLGGEARYKRSLANAETELLWLEVRPKSPWQSLRRAVSSS
jgi:CelD/BcsL family acetyltransferase involved in cellulose biosynthesis